MQSTLAAPSPHPGSLRSLKRLVLLNHPGAIRLAYGGGREYSLSEAAKLAFGAWSVSDLLSFEGELCKRWIKEIESFGPDDALLMNTLSAAKMTARDGLLAPIWDAAEQCLGDRFIVTNSVPGPESALGCVMKEQLRRSGYNIAPQTLEVEAWGESFEGCVPNYAGHIASGLGLPRGFPMRYGMTLADAPFTRDSNFLERVWVGETDVSLYLFQTRAGQPFGIYFPGVIDPSAPQRFAHINAEAVSLEFTNKLGQAQEVEARGGVLSVPLYVDGYGEPLYIWGSPATATELKSVLQGATISQA